MVSRCPLFLIHSNILMKRQPLLAREGKTAVLSTRRLEGQTSDCWRVVHPVKLAAGMQASYGDVAQLVRALPCHGRGRGFEPRRPRHTKQRT